MLRHLCLIAVLCPSLAWATHAATTPGGLLDAARDLGASNGSTLALSPMQHADQQMYFLHGKIAVADEDPIFFANVSGAESARPLPLRGNERYFLVMIPKALQAYYFEHGRIGEGFDLVGKYVGNTEYRNAQGETVTATIFAATHFDLWSKRQGWRPLLKPTRVPVSLPGTSTAPTPPAR